MTELLSAIALLCQVHVGVGIAYPHTAAAFVSEVEARQQKCQDELVGCLAPKYTAANLYKAQECFRRIK